MKSMPIDLLAALALASVLPATTDAAPPTASPKPDVITQFVRQTDNLAAPADVAIGDNGHVYAVLESAHRVDVFDAYGKPIKTFGGLGSEPGQFRSPQGICVGPDGSIFIADTGNHRVSIFDNDGKHVRSFGSFGAGQGQINHPVAVSADAANIFVADYFNDRVQVFDRDGKWKLTCGRRGARKGRFSGPSDLDVDSAGRIYVADRFNNRVQVFDSNGEFVNAWGTWGAAVGMFNSPCGIDVGGQVFVADAGNHRVQAFSIDGSSLYEWGAHVIRPHEGNGKIHYPVRVAVSGRNQSAVICESFENRLQWFKTSSAASSSSIATPWWQKGGSSHFGPRGDVSGKLLALTEPDAHTVLLYDVSRDLPLQISTFGTYGRGHGQFVYPTVVKFDPTGKLLLVADEGTRRLQVLKINMYDDPEIKNRPNLASAVRSYDFDAISATIPGVKLVRPLQTNAIDWITKDRLIILDTANAKIFELSDRMQVVKSLGEHGDGPGQFNHPTDMVVHGDDIFVVDAYNLRVQVFDAKSGDVKHSWGSYGTGDGQFIAPYGISVDQEGLVRVTDTGSHSVTTFTTNGEFVSRMGTRGIEAKQFYKPMGIISDQRDRTFVVDFGNHRGQVFSRDGKFRSAFGARFYVKPAKANAE